MSHSFAFVCVLFQPELMPVSNSHSILCRVNSHTVIPLYRKHTSIRSHPPLCKPVPGIQRPQRAACHPDPRRPAVRSWAGAVVPAGVEPCVPVGSVSAPPRVVQHCRKHGRVPATRRHVGSEHEWRVMLGCTLGRPFMGEGARKGAGAEEDGEVERGGGASSHAEEAHGARRMDSLPQITPYIIERQDLSESTDRGGAVLDGLRSCV